MLDVMVVWGERGRVEAVVKVNEGGAFERARHLPWFVAQRYMPYRGIVDYREVPLRFYRFNEGSWRYEKVSDASYIVYTETPGLVRRVSQLYEDNNIPCALNNVRYKARVSMDLADTLFGLKVPAMLHYGLDELEVVVRELMERAGGVEVMSFDIEVRAEGSFPRLGEEVFLVSLCWGGLMDDSEECAVLEKDEVFDLMKVVERVRPHYLVGFVSSTFDIPYLRAYVQGLPLDREGVLTDSLAVPHIDAAEILEQHGSSFGLPFGARLALDDVARRLGLVKDERELEIESSIDRSRIYLEYQRDRERVLRYAETDARLTLRVGKEILRTLMALYLITGISPSTVQILPSFGALAEYAVLDVVRRRFGKVYEVRSTRYTAKELADGIAFYRKGTKEHFVREGVWENVAYLDFNMLYPTVYYSCRLDPEGVRVGAGGFRVYLVPRDLDGDAYLKDAVALDASFEGGDIYNVLAYFYEGRRITKKLKKEFPSIDQAMKILANSAYGMFAKGRGGAVNEVVSAFIFFKSSQVFVNTLGIIKNVLGLDYVYGATDSFFVLLRDGVDPKRLEEELNRQVQLRFGPGFSVKLEGVCRRFALLKRKTYVCILESDGGREVLIKGMEKLEIPQVVKENLGEIFERVLEGEDWRRVVYEYIGSATVPELFVKVSKRLSDLYDEEEGRFKNANSNRIKAVLIRWLIDEGQRIERVGRLPFHLDAASLPEQTVVARFLATGRAIAGKKAISVLVDYGEDRADVYECGLVRCRATRTELEGVFHCVERSLTRREVEELALRKSEPVIEYLRQIESMTKQRRLV